MATLKFTNALKQFFPDLQPGEYAGTTIAEILEELGRKHPGLPAYLVDDQGALRKHVNIFVGTSLILDKVTLLDPVGPEDEIFIMQALSGG